MKKINNIMKRILSFIIAFAIVLMAIGFTGCNIRVSSYRALMLVQTNTKHEASMSFSEFTGTKVFTLKVVGNKEMMLSYSAELDNGKAEVFYEYNGEKTDLFTIESGEEKNSKVGPFSSGTIYITVKTMETCDEGKFVFSLN